MFPNIKYKKHTEFEVRLCFSCFICLYQLHCLPPRRISPYLRLLKLNSVPSGCEMINIFNQINHQGNANQICSYLLMGQKDSWQKVTYLNTETGAVSRYLPSYIYTIVLMQLAKPLQFCDPLVSQSDGGCPKRLVLVPALLQMNPWSSFPSTRLHPGGSSWS